MYDIISAIYHCSVVGIIMDDLTPGNQTYTS